MKQGLIHLILCTAGNTDPNPKGTAKDSRKPVIWDTENDPARAKLQALAKGKLAGRMIDRMFNSSARIGHNKFAVYVKGGKALAVMSGSTNWTETGLCTQSNNTIILEDPGIADDYWAYWKRLRDDKQPAREPLAGTGADGKPLAGSKGNSAKQAPAIRGDNAKPLKPRALAAGTAQLWCSPNTAQASVPAANPPRPPDLTQVYDLMDKAKQAILFLTFLPGVSGKNNIIGEAAALAAKKNGPFVMGAVSDPSALPPPASASDAGTFTNAQGRTQKLPPPAIWWPDGDQSRIVMIRAAAVRIPFGNLRPELLTAGHAIIHDKIIVIDPLDATNCAVITGSHNLGYKASYCNDDNLLVVRGNRPLALAYAVHVLDIYDHYVMRARLEQNLRDQLKAGKIHSFEEAAATAEPHGLLHLDAKWQDKHFGKRPRSALDYFLDNAAAAPAAAARPAKTKRQKA